MQKKNKQGFTMFYNGTTLVSLKKAPLKPIQVNYFNTIFKSSRAEVLCKNCVFRNFAKFTGKHLCQSLFFNKVAGFWFQVFPVNFAKFLRTLFLTNTSSGCFCIFVEWILYFYHLYMCDLSFTGIFKFMLILAVVWNQK